MRFMCEVPAALDFGCFFSLDPFRFTWTFSVHPLAIVGITGVIVNALNLMPIGSLDGGRIAMSAFGRKAGGVLGTITLLLQVGCWRPPRVLRCCLFPYALDLI